MCQVTRHPSVYYGRARLLAVRWDRLFDDIETQLDADEQAELRGEVDERTRLEVARIGLFDRLRQATGRPVELTVAGLGRVEGVLDRVGPDWLVVEPAPMTSMLVTGAGLLAVGALPLAAMAADATGRIDARIDVRHVLRALARDRAALTIGLADGSTRTGTVDRVGADFVDLAEHPLDQPRRAAQVSAYRTVSLAGIRWVRSG